jgi:nucleoside 2-deoxyribosyltransferase
VTHRDPDLWTVFKWDARSSEQSFWQLIKGKLKVVLLNGNQFDKAVVYNKETLQQFIDTYYPKLSPDDKLDSILEYLSDLTEYEGQSVVLETPTDDKANRLFFARASEWLFYLDTAVKLGLINRIDEQHKGNVPRFNLTITGLSRLLTINESKASKFCFVATAFNDEMDSIFENAIAPAIKACGFEPYRVKDQTIDPDVTINDAILAGIKKSRFTVSDFTLQRPGVYFEAGYALGRGQKVIYICKEEDIVNAHFDTRNYQHLLWTDAIDLKQKLIDRIEAYIMD